MELSSAINNTWKLCLITSLLGCFILLFFAKQNYQNASFSAAQNTMLKLAPVVYQAEAPVSSEIREPSNVSSNTSSNTIDIRPNSTLFDHAPNPSIALSKLASLNNSTTERKCNIFDGKWVYKPEEVPSYDTNKCPFIEEKISCRKNGRQDSEYEKWRWEAKDCNIPLFNAKDMLERLRNKRVIIVGDSLNRNMWESLSCLLYFSVTPSSAEVHAKSSAYKVLILKDYNTTVEFHWSPFLVQLKLNHKSGKKVIVLDKLSPNSKQWQGADVMVFNSGHWWTHHKGKFKAWDLFQYKGQLLEAMPVELAYDRAMKTWAKWVEKNNHSNKTRVFFRSISAEHNGKPWCYNSTQPIMDESYKNNFPRSLINIIENLVKGMSKSQVEYLNITKLSEYRIDAHPSVYRSYWKWKIYTTKYKRLLPSYADCSHWCLPGLPDTWNRLLYASLFFDIVGKTYSSTLV